MKIQYWAAHINLTPPASSRGCHRRSEPEIFLVHDFFSASQCERLIRKAQEGDAMVPAGVAWQS